MSDKKEGLKEPVRHFTGTPAKADSPIQYSESPQASPPGSSESGSEDSSTADSQSTDSSQKDHDEGGHHTEASPPPGGSGMPLLIPAEDDVAFSHSPPSEQGKNNLAT